MCALYYLRVGLSQLRFSNSSQQHARTGGGKHSPTCELDYQVRTNSEVGQLTAACPHRGVNSSKDRGGLRAARSSMPAQGESNSLRQGWDSSQQHARTRGIRVSYECIVLSQGWTKSTQVFEQLTAACPYRGSQTLSYM